MLFEFSESTSEGLACVDWSTFKVWSIVNLVADMTFEKSDLDFSISFTLINIKNKINWKIDNYLLTIIITCC